MPELMGREQILTRIRGGIAEQEAAARQEADPVKRERLLRHARSRHDYAEEEADAVKADIAENVRSA